MKYIDEFRDAARARVLADAIAAEATPGRRYRLMEFCGGHTHAISRWGVADLLPPAVEMIHGPGCPVCVLPIGRLDLAIRLAIERRVTLATFGDCLRVPASDGLSLLKAKALGADVRMVYSPHDALQLAQQDPAREVVFFAIGFETTTPPTALLLLQAERLALANFSVLCNHVLTPAAIDAILGAKPQAPLDGLVGPAHVSTVIGSAPYEAVARRWNKPIVIAGFEPLDVMQAVRMLIRQIDQGRADVENEFTRAVVPHGNRRAQALVAEVFERRPAFEWRGLGSVPDSALAIRPRFAAWDAERRYGLVAPVVADHKACECAAILRGEKHPRDCKVFGTVCTPDHPIGSCMVSSEGACAAHHAYGRFRQRVPVPVPVVPAAATAS